jgi:divalent metal cation (Fe/Co/Zn/Cd) transporter
MTSQSSEHPFAEGDDAPPGAAPGSESTLTVVVALAANGLITVAKLVAAIITGSSAMLAETYVRRHRHNEVLLLVAQRRSRRAADADHPLGYGREAYFWSLLAAVGVFVAGSVVALREGLHELNEVEALVRRVEARLRAHSPAVERVDVVPAG